jgi:disulfide oxidoreductase YuzD
LEQWVEILYESRNADLPFVEFNYSNLTYLDGNENNTQLNEEEFGIMIQAESYLYDMFDDDDEDVSENRRRRRNEFDTARDYEAGRWDMFNEMGAQGAFDD